MSFYIPGKADKDTLLEVKLDIPGEEKPISITGTVVWTYKPHNSDKEYAVGLKFCDITNIDKARLLDYAYSEWLKERGR